MKKKFLSLMFGVVGMLACAFGFSACEQPHEHEYTKETTTEATCMEKGVKTYTCACGDTYTEEIPALGHDEETHQAQAPTCTEIGWEEYVTCQREGCGYTTYEEIPATGEHTWDNGVETKAPTCMEEGETTYTCTVCEEATYTEAIPALTHDEETHEAKAPTCTESGWGEYVTCEREGCGYTTYEEIPATGVHTWDKGEEIKASTCTEEGETTYTCTVCKTTTKTEPINKLPHDHAEKWTSNATYHWHECVCGDKKGEEKHVAGAPATATTPQICTVCGYVLHEETGILFNTLTVAGTKVYGVVSNATTDFSFIDEVTVKGSATYVVDDDKDCNTPIKSKTVDLESGDNTFYVLEMIGNDVKLFTVTIHRRPMYDVTFDVDGGTAVAAQKVEEGYLATEPTTTKVGYTFAGWDYDFTQPITEHTKITASWIANKDTKYTVIYYWQNIEDDNYTPHETVELKGETDTTANAEIKAYAHFTYNKDTGTVSGNIDGDGGLVLSVYYARNTYTLSVNNAYIGNITNVGTYKYGNQEVITEIDEVSLGYEFIGWYSGEELLSTDDTYTFTVDKNVTAQFAVKAEMSNFTFTSTATTCEITGIMDKTVTEIIVPDYVKSIEQGAFSGCDRLESITIPFVGNHKNATRYEGVFGYIFGYTTATSQKEISGATLQFVGGGYYYYYIPESLREVIITSAERIGERAFYNCSKLTSISIPACLTKIEAEAFGSCWNLASVHITDIKAWCKISFGDTGANPLGYAGNLYLNNELITEIVIPDTVTIINNYLFYNCDSLTSVVIGDGVTWIGNQAFADCENLTSVVIGDSVTTIGEKAFQMCENLTDLVIGSSVTSIGSRAFQSCSSLADVVIPDSVTTIGEYAFGGCSSLESITIPFVGGSRKTANDTYQYPFGYIFGTGSYTGGTATTQYYYGSSKSSTTYTTYYIPTSLKSVTVTGGDILYGAFYNCDSLTSVVIGDSVTSIGVDAFRGCDNLTSVVIGDSVTTIGSSAFGGCSSLESITIPFVGAKAGVTASDTYQYPFGYIFGTSSYTGGTGAKQYYYGSNTSSTTSTAYYIPRSLKSVTVTGGNILYGAFYNCRSLTSVDIGDGVTTIGDSAFYNCSSLTSVVIGDSVTWIGNQAFADCDSLTSVVIGDSVTTIGDRAFEWCSSLTSVVISDSVTTIGERAFYECSSLTSVVIGDSVTSIGDYAFSACIKLVEVVNKSTHITVTKGDSSNGDVGYYAWAVYNSGDAFTSKLSNDNGYIIYTDGTEKILLGYKGTETDLVLPSYITKIYQYAFLNCDSLTSVVIGDSVTSIGEYAFAYCYSLTNIHYRGTEEQWNAITKGNNWDSSTGDYTITYNYAG